MTGARWMSLGGVLLVMLPASAHAAPGWTEADLLACEAGDRPACQRLVDGSAREALTTVQASGRGLVPPEMMVHLILACRSGDAVACVASDDTSGACALGLDVGCSPYYPLGCGQQESCPPLRRTVEFEHHRQGLSPVVFGAGLLMSDTHNGLLRSPLRPLLHAELRWVGEVRGALWVARGNGNSRSSTLDGFTVLSADGAREVAVSLPADTPFVGSIRTDGLAVILSVRDRPLAEQSGKTGAVRVGEDGTVTPVSGPEGASLQSMAHGWSVWRTASTLTRVAPDGKQSTLPVPEGTKAVHVSRHGIVAIQAAPVRLWEADGQVRTMPFEGLPETSGATWSPSGRRLALQFGGVLVITDSTGSVVDRWWLPRAAGVGLDWVGEDLVRYGTSVVGPVGSPAPVLPAWLDGVARAHQPDPDEAVPVDPEHPGPAAGPPIACSPERYFAWEADALWTSSDRKQTWARHPLRTVEVRDGHGRLAWGHPIPLQFPEGFGSLILPSDGWNVRLPDPGANGAVQRGGKWVFETTATGVAAQVSSVSRPIDGPYRGIGRAGRLDGSMVLHAAERWLVVQSDPAVERLDVIYRVSDDRILLLDVHDLELTVATRDE